MRPPLRARARDLITKLDELANTFSAAAASIPGPKTVIPDAEDLENADRVVRLTERATAYRHAATLARNTLT